MFTERWNAYHGKILDFHPYGTINERAKWASLAPAWQEGTLALGQSYLGFPYPWLSALDYMEFTRTGNRSHFEEKYFAKRLALDALALAECTEDKGRFLDDIANGIFSICEESAWQLPAHNTYIRDTPQLPLADASEPVLDLFACETAAILATVSYLLQERLAQISPLIGKRIQEELQRRIFTPYLGRHFWWMGNGQEPMNNWTIWCTQNVMLAAFLTDTDQGLRQDVLRKACQSADYFLAEYGEDGCCDEGAQYYRHAGLCLFQFLEIANAVTGGAFQEVYQEGKIRNIAAYILNVHVHGPYYINFADCSPIAGRAGTREFLFGQRTQNTALMQFAASEFAAGGRDSLLLPQEHNLYYRLQNGFHAQELRSYAASCPPSICHPDIYYPSAGLFLARDGRFCLAVKAGGNDDSHNHNDTGSFTIYKDGVPFLIDVGVESYTQKTFSPQRYEIWTMQSAYHNLPTIRGVMQQAGKEYCAKQVRWSFAPALCQIEMELAGAYPPEAGIRTYRRKAALHKGSHIAIEDCFTLDPPAPGPSQASPVILSLMTHIPPQIHAQDEAHFTLQLQGMGEIAVTSGAWLRTEEIPITDPRLSQTWESSIYRTLAFALDGRITLRIS